MAVWREALRRIGGFARVAHFLSDDHLLGKALAQAGYKVGVSLWPVENRNVSCSVRRTIERHTRWAKIRRVVAPAGFALEPALSPVVVATVAWLASPTFSLALAFMLALIVQIAGSMLTTSTLRGSTLGWYWAPLELARCYLLFFCWLKGCLSRRVSWRGHNFELGRASRIVPAGPNKWNRVRAIGRA